MAEFLNLSAIVHSIPKLEMRLLKNSMLCVLESRHIRSQDVGRNRIYTQFAESM